MSRTTVDEQLALTRPSEVSLLQSHIYLQMVLQRPRYIRFNINLDGGIVLKAEL